MKNPLSFKLLYLLSKICYWGLIIIIAIVVFAGTIMLTLDPQLMKLGFPANLSYVDEVMYLNSDVPTAIEVEFSADLIRVPVKYMDRPTMSAVLLMSLLSLSCLAFIAAYFKKYMKRVLDGQIFHSVSIRLIKKAALALLVLEAIDIVASVVGHYYVLAYFDLGSFENSFSWSFPSSTLILALTLWALAHIFQKGKELEDEQKLTV